jgi:4-hydroxy-tetrahydrodipicolinate reductase
LPAFDEFNGATAVSEPKIRVAVHGACGRMGLRVCDAALRDPETVLVGAVDHAKHPQQAADVGVMLGVGESGVKVATRLPAALDVAIDFSVPEACLHIARQCADRQIPLVVATTGFSPAQRAELEAFHHQTPLLVAANCSLVVNLLLKLTRLAAETLKGRDFDVEIVERHHRYKVDSPSGTALKFAEIVQEAMDLTERRHGREGLVGERPRTEIGLHAIRAGDNVGEHAVIFSTLGETMELVHKGHSRDSYALGAVAAAKFLASKKAGLYTMADVLGL